MNLMNRRLALKSIATLGSVFGLGKVAQAAGVKEVAPRDGQSCSGSVSAYEDRVDAWVKAVIAFSENYPKTRDIKVYLGVPQKVYLGVPQTGENFIQLDVLQPLVEDVQHGWLFEVRRVAEKLWEHWRPKEEGYKEVEKLPASSLPFANHKDLPAHTCFLGGKLVERVCTPIYTVDMQEMSHDGWPGLLD
jgi:hypothetical protein